MGQKVLFMAPLVEAPTGQLSIATRFGAPCQPVFPLDIPGELDDGLADGASCARYEASLGQRALAASTRSDFAVAT